jgi:hypothetical protein
LLLEEASEGKAVWDENAVAKVGKWIYAMPSSSLHQASRVIENLKGDKKDKVSYCTDTEAKIFRK